MSSDGSNDISTSSRASLDQSAEEVAHTAAWSASRSMVQYGVAVPDETSARSVAEALVERGHRWVTVVPLDRLRRLPKAEHLIRREREFSGPELAGWWHAGSLVDEQAPAGAPLTYTVAETLDEMSRQEPDSYAEGIQQEHERAAVEALARRHGGFAGSGWTSLRAGTLRDPASQRPAPELFDLGGLVGELDQEQAHAVRRSVTAGFPPGPERLPGTERLECDGGEREYPPLLECVRSVAGRLLENRRDPLAGSAAASRKPWDAALTGGVVAAWSAAEDDDFDDDGDVGFWLEESVLRQGICFPHTAEGVPLLAGLAVHDDVHPAHRAEAVACLFAAATAGRRTAAAEADRRFALGLSMDESDGERAARLATEATAPGLLSRWDREGEAMRFALAALTAACPAAAASTGAIEGVRGLAARWTGRPRADTLQLLLALAEDETSEISAALNGYLQRAHRRPGEVPSPHAPARGAALELLNGQVRKEVMGLGPL
ncbi:hypothetical protein [Actinomadura violacea]|uniref:Uncharacterized protein n=1 Tax=Actinomadura violacea TaxID=2819934 RepID=A0ABS3S5P7_9ACTN|nr:hypothetical protein [Actinomadura violacea]MBO2464324.1 hypothetical protein [Actinomadura violacea]